MTRRTVTHTAGQEARVLARLAFPVALAQVGMLTMGLVDTWFVGRLGTVDLAAVALGDQLFFTFMLIALRTVRGLDPLVSQAYGAGDPRRVAASWRAGRLLAILLTPALAAIVFGFEPLLGLWRQVDPRIDPALIQTTVNYVKPRTLGILPGLLFTADRSLLYGLGDTRPAMVVLLLANLLNVFLDWVLIFGHLGAPALGAPGSALGTSLALWCMFGALAWYVRRPRYAVYRDQPVPRRRPLLQLVRLGTPNGLAAGLEISAFTAASVLMAKLGVAQLASHQVAMKMVSTSYMVALALGTATSIRVGHAVGDRDPRGAARAGWVGMALGLLAMCATGLVFLTCGRAIVAAFSQDPQVIELGAALLAIGAAFQLSDGAQAIAAGAIRGTGDTTFPFLAGLVAYWGLGVPLSAYLVLERGAGAQAIWWSLAAGLTLAAVILVARFWTVKDPAPLPEA